MAESDGQERTEKATGKRRQDARQKGQIPRSRELNTVATLLVAAAAFFLMGGRMIQGLSDQFHKGLALERRDAFDVALLVAHFQQAAIEALWMVAPFFALMVLVAVLASIALGGWSFSTQALTFKPQKLNPVKGLGKIFAWRGLVEMLKGLAKFLLVALVAGGYLAAHADTFLGLGNESLPQAMAHMSDLIGWGFLTSSLALLLVAAIDVPFQLWDHERQLRMTKQEIKEEHKQTEGSPEVKGRLRRMQLEMAQRRMMQEVPKADVVVTNPTHYAVALRYDQATMDSPVVVAKGTGLVAGNIRKVAAEHEVPILSAPPLARAIYHHTELNDPIPFGLYRAVAQLLAYVYHLRREPWRAREGHVLADLPIPDDLRRDE